jgi:hypothetical protein
MGFIAPQAADLKRVDVHNATRLSAGVSARSNVTKVMWTEMATRPRLFSVVRQFWGRAAGRPAIRSQDACFFVSALLCVYSRSENRRGVSSHRKLVQARCYPDGLAGLFELPYQHSSTKIIFHDEHS